MVQWTHHSNVADVLSLGPRIAGRLMQVGVRSVAELLAAKPRAVARRIDDDRFSAEIVELWQREAHLALAAPALPLLAVRTFAAIGYRSPERIARSTPTELLAAIETTIGQGRSAAWLKNNSRPSVSELAAWIHCAQQSYDPRAA